MLPFLIDTAGNALDLYDTIGWWDDANHFVNWALLSGAVAAALLRTHVGRADLFGLVAGVGVVTAILWEVGEYFAFIRNSPELATAYTDALGDLALGLGGATLAAAIAEVALGRRRSRAERGIADSAGGCQPVPNSFTQRAAASTWPKRSSFCTATPWVRHSGRNRFWRCPGELSQPSRATRGAP